MPLQLIYTSIREGLDIGRSGFCTVAKTQGMKRALSSELESISHYDFDKAGAKHIFTYRIISTGDERFFVCSRLAACGVDYTGRTNFIAHHVAFRSNELSAYGNPACFMQNWKGWYDSWMGSARELSESEFKNFSLARVNKEAKTWASISRQENKDFLLESKNVSFVDIDESTYLSLLSESFFAQENAQWDYSFTTRVQRNESVRSYAINLADEFVLSILPEDFLKLSPKTYLLNLKKKAAQEESNYASRQSMSFGGDNQAYQSEGNSSLDNTFNMPDFDLDKKKSNFSLYLFLGSLIVSLLAGVSLFLYLKPKEKPLDEIAISPLSQQITPSAALSTSDLKPESSVAEEQAKAEAEALEKERLAQEAYREKQRLLAEEKERKKKEQEKKIAQEKKAPVIQEEKPKEIAKEGDSDAQKLAKLFGVKNSSDFADAEKVFLSYQRSDNSYLINLAEFKKLYPDLEGNIFDSKKVNIVSSSLGSGAKFSFSPNGNDLFLEKNARQSQLWTSPANSKNAKLEEPFFLNVKAKEGKANYGVFFIDNREMLLDAKASDVYDLSSVVVAKDFIKLVNALSLRAGSTYSLELKTDVSEAFNKVLSNSKQGTVNYKKANLDRAFAEISKNYKDYISNIKALEKNKKVKPKMPLKDSSKPLSGNARAAMVVGKNYIPSSESEKWLSSMDKSDPVARFKDIFKKKREKGELKSNSFSSGKSVFIAECDDAKKNLNLDDFLASVKEVYLEKGRKKDEEKSANEAREAKLGGDWDSFAPDLKKGLASLQKEIDDNAKKIDAHAANIVQKGITASYWKSIDSDMKAIESAYMKSWQALKAFAISPIPEHAKINKEKQEINKKIIALKQEQNKYWQEISSYKSNASLGRKIRNAAINARNAAIETCEKKIQKHLNTIKALNKKLEKYNMKGQYSVESYILWKLFGIKFWADTRPQFLKGDSFGYYNSSLSLDSIFRYKTYEDILSDIEATVFNDGIDGRYEIAKKKYNKELEAWEAVKLKIETARDNNKKVLLKYFNEAEINDDILMGNLTSKSLADFLNLSKVYIKFNVK